MPHEVYLNMMINKCKMESTDHAIFEAESVSGSFQLSKLSVSAGNFAFLQIVQKLDSVVGSLPPSRGLEDALDIIVAQ